VSPEAEVDVPKKVKNVKEHDGLGRNFIRNRNSMNSPGLLRARKREVKKQTK